MSYIGVQPVPKASLILTQGTFGSSSQTITVPGGYQPGNIFVYINGFRLQTSEYTATDGSIIDLGESFPSGTDYIVEEIRSFTIPDHYTKAEIQNASFDFVNMPTVGGDPVVESGSNSDGEWTRWADGTQGCSKYNFDKSTNPHTYTYPMPFVGTPSVVASSRSIGAFHPTVASETTTSADIFVWGSDGSGNNLVNVNLQVNGRWK